MTEGPLGVTWSNSLIKLLHAIGVEKNKLDIVWVWFGWVWLALVWIGLLVGAIFCQNNSYPALDL